MSHKINRCSTNDHLAVVMKKKFYISLLLTLLAYGVARAQTYPVQTSVQLVPPFSGYLNDYASPGNDNLRVFLTFMDFSQPVYDVKLKFKLTGNNITIQSKTWSYAGPFTRAWCRVDSKTPSRHCKFTNPLQHIPSARFAHHSAWLIALCKCLPLDWKSNTRSDSLIRKKSIFLFHQIIPVWNWFPNQK